DLHAVRLELADLEARFAQADASLVVADQAQAGGVFAGHRDLAADEVVSAEAVGIQFEAPGLYRQAARVTDHQLDRQAGEHSLPVATADDGADVCGFTGAVKAAVAEQVGAQARGVAVVLQAAGVEARQVEAMAITV